MAWYNPFLKAPSKENTKQTAFAILPENHITESMKGEVDQRIAVFPKNVGEVHPFDPKLTEGVIKQYGPVAGIIDKYVDYIWGSGFCVDILDQEGVVEENAQKVINDFNRSVSMNVLGRAWIKEALVKPGGYFELSSSGKVFTIKILDGKYMYVNRDKLGVISGYTQYTGGFSDGKWSNVKTITFKPTEVIPLHFNVIGDSAYGLGIVYPNLNTINDMMGLEKDIKTLIHRKANSPLILKFGNADKDILPTQEDLNRAKNDLQVLTPQTEWCFDANVDVSTVDFGNLGDKFVVPFDQNWKKIVAGFQIPEVLLGWGDIAEGLAGAQGDGWERVIETKREQADTVLSGLYDRILAVNGFSGLQTRIVWGAPTDKERTDKIAQIMSIMPLVQPNFKFELEKKLAALLDIDEEVLEDAPTQAVTENNNLAAQQKILNTDGGNKK